MANRYETVFILTPVLSDSQAKETVKSFTKLLENEGGKVIHEDNWGLKKLAYPIQNKSTGFYHLIEFEAEGDAVDKLEVAFRREERVMRFLTVAMDKHHIEFAEKQRKKASKKSEKKKEKVEQ